MGVLVSLSTLLRMVALGFALGIVVGLYVGLGGAPEPGSATCTPTAVEHCERRPAPAPAEGVSPEAAS